MGEKKELDKNTPDVEINQDFGKEIDKFIKHIESQADIAPLVMNLVTLKLVQESRHVDKYIKENRIVKTNIKTNNCDIEAEESQKDELTIPADKFKEFITLHSIVETTSIAYDLLPINFVVSFVSQYDAYLGGLIRTMFNVKPELLNNSEKNISFSELIKFSSIDVAKECLIENEVESVLRDSHLKQFRWLENKLGITLRKDLPSFPDFIEITERRNLFVHCNGVVSRQYIEICKENNVNNIDQINIGDKLTVKPEYYNKCYCVLFEIGIKLGQVLWRKLLPQDIKNADNHLNNVCYDLLVKGHLKLAHNLLSFATDSLKKHCNQEMECVFTINKALSYYLSDKIDKCEAVLNKHDWSATCDKFKLAIAVLREENENVYNLMKTIGVTNEEITKDAYRDWPLFKKLRKLDIFKETYKEIFGEEFAYVEQKPKELADILAEMQKLKKEAEMVSCEEKTAPNNTYM